MTTPRTPPIRQICLEQTLPEFRTLAGLYAEIDQLVYQLYGLTEEENAVVAGR